MECANALSLLNNHLNLNKFGDCQNAGKNFSNELSSRILQEVYLNIIISCTLTYSFGKQKENKLRQQILYLCLNIQT